MTVPLDASGGRHHDRGMRAALALWLLVQGAMFGCGPSPPPDIRFVSPESGANVESPEVDVIAEIDSSVPISTVYLAANGARFRQVAIPPRDQERFVFPDVPLGEFYRPPQPIALRVVVFAGHRRSTHAVTIHLADEADEASAMLRLQPTPATEAPSAQGEDGDDVKM